MGRARTITILTDFGLSDVYVGVMKGVIALVNPRLKVIDLTHEIPPQDIATGSFALAQACEFFPHDTVHLAVVDPGVGSSRKGVAIRTKQGIFVGPDNGLFSGVLKQSPALLAMELNCPQYWRTFDPAPTFHGRDIFASVAAHLANGLSIAKVGTPMDVSHLVSLKLPGFSQIADGYAGVIQAADRFGNLITNIPGLIVEGLDWGVHSGGTTIRRVTSYADQKAGTPISLVGGHGFIEIAVVGGSARQSLGLKVGDQIRIFRSPRAS